MKYLKSDLAVCFVVGLLIFLEHIMMTFQWPTWSIAVHISPWINYLLIPFLGFVVFDRIKNKRFWSFSLYLLILAALLIFVFLALTLVKG